MGSGRPLQRIDEAKIQQDSRCLHLRSRKKAKRTSYTTNECYNLAATIKTIRETSLSTSVRNPTQPLHNLRPRKTLRLLLPDLSSETGPQSELGCIPLLPLRRASLETVFPHRSHSPTRVYPSHVLQPSHLGSTDGDVSKLCPSLCQGDAIATARGREDFDGKRN